MNGPLWTISDAIAYLGARPCGDGWRYPAKDTGTWCHVDLEALEALIELTQDPDAGHEAHARWCAAGHGTRECVGHDVVPDAGLAVFRDTHVATTAKGGAR